MTKAQASATKAEIIRYAMDLENRVEELEQAVDNGVEFSLEEHEGDIQAAIDKGIKEYKDELDLAIFRGATFEELKELITGRIES